MTCPPKYAPLLLAALVLGACISAAPAIPIVDEITFTADPSAIPSRQCSELAWLAEEADNVWVYPVGATYTDHPVDNPGSQMVCPLTTTEYEIRASFDDGAVSVKQVIITVTPGNALAESNWVLAGLVGGTLLAETAPTARFAADGLLAGDGGCNAYSTAYAISQNNLLIGPQVTTELAACGDSVDAQEAAYLDALIEANMFMIEEGQLVLFDITGHELVRYDRAGMQN